MDNIQIKRTPQKRNIESLLDESALDNSYNHEAQQLRQAYTKTIKSLNTRIKQLESSLTKLQIELKQKDEIIVEQHQEIVVRDNRILALGRENGQMSVGNGVMRKRLQHLEYRLQGIENNRKEVLQYVHAEPEEKATRRDEEQAENIKKEVYREIKQILNGKIGKFVKEMKNYTMSIELENSIEAFLEDILYINSSESRRGGLFVEERDKARRGKIGKISSRGTNIEGQEPREKISQMEQWKKMQKSLQKLKSISPMGKRSALKQPSTRSRYNLSPVSRPLINYT